MPQYYYAFMKNLLIIGARGFGREVYNLYLACKEAGADINCNGFLDDKESALDGYNNYPPILSSVEDYQICEDDVFICALGDVHYKQKYVEIIKSKGGHFISLIHPSVSIGTNTSIGEGCIVRYHSSISCDITIGDFVTIMGFCIIGHDAEIGNYSHLGAHCFMGGFSRLEDSVVMHPGSRLLPHKTVKRNAIIGAGSVVLTNVKEATTVLGVPAKKLNF